MKVLFIVIIIIFNSFCYSQNNALDSLKIVTLFNVVSKQPNSIDSILGEVKQLINTPDLEDTYLYGYSKFLFQTAQLDSAIVVAEKGIRLNTTDSKEQYKSFKFHNILGSVYVYKNKHKASVIEFQKSIELLERHNNFHQSALIKNNLANVFFSLNDYESSYKYSKEAYNTLKSESDSTYLPSITAIFAISAMELNKDAEAKKLGNEGLELSRKIQ